ncbi:AAA family ATPase [Bradyrhizobium sp. Tv2a-2]|uniref:ATP-dependent nuclease n=1 Tax=Bradyrhizobium sp. Tv2a-2 TaxID=113395 RepID=UPI0004131662|nr:AAA family ATPase [Bradyrhizobium sp. Tv2a-2]
MITSISIGYIKSFAKPQSIELARPNGERGSGYNVIVGQNNTGKSTLITMTRLLLSNDDRITIGQEARREPQKPVLEITWQNETTEEQVWINNNVEGAIFQKSGNRHKLRGKTRFVPSRRPFGSDYNVSPLRVSEYEANELSARLSNPAYFDGYLATSIATLFGEESSKAAFLKALAAVDPSTAKFSTDNIGGRNVLLYTGPSKLPHVVSDTGDGITNLVRIIYSLVTSEPGSCIIIDEPELSLHPQLQRNLFKVLLDYSQDRQVVCVTHSPHFVGWREISGPAKLFRVSIDEAGESRIASPTSSSFNAVNAHSDVMSRKYYDSVCKELFFADRAVLLEGSEDVHYIENFLEATNQAPLPIMGYGCGGASVIRPWMRLCVDLGIKCAAIFDGDRKSEYEAAVNEFAAKSDCAQPFLLFKDDIRDKYERAPSGAETSTIAKEGVFRRDGAIHLTRRDEFQTLVEQVRAYLI